MGPLVLSGTLDAALLRHVQALKLSEHEALAAYGDDRRRARSGPSASVPEVLVTFGEYGAARLVRGGLGPGLRARP